MKYFLLNGILFFFFYSACLPSAPNVRLPHRPGIGITLEQMDFLENAINLISTDITSYEGLMKKTQKLQHDSHIGNETQLFGNLVMSCCIDFNRLCVCARAQPSCLVRGVALVKFCSFGSRLRCKPLDAVVDLSGGQLARRQMDIVDQ